MKANKALNKWAFEELSLTLSLFNEYMSTVGKPTHTINEDSISINFMISDPVKCEDGHSWDDNICVDAIPPRPALVLQAMTNEGQILRNEKHSGEFTIEEFFNTVINSAGEPLTV